MNIPKKRNIAIIANTEEAYYLQSSINTLNQSGESYLISEYLTLDDPKLKLDKHDVIFIISPALLAALNDSKIEEYVYQGGHIVALPGSNALPNAYSNINLLSANIKEDYLNVHLAKLSKDDFQEIDPNSIKIREMVNLFSSSRLRPAS